MGMVHALLALGAPIEQRDTTYGSSALGWAAHGSQECRSADDDYLAVVEALIAAGANRGASINRWGGTPESMASKRVAARIRKHLEASGNV